jgi:hypothetical protein
MRKIQNGNGSGDQIDLAELDRRLQHALVDVRTDGKKTNDGYVHLVLVRRSPDWIVVCETPTFELPDGRTNLNAPDPDFLVVACSRFEDRFAAISLVRERLASVARQAGYV